MEAYERKIKALEYFKDLLLQSKVRNKIAKLILFGSLAKGEVTDDSDIDILVVALGDPKEVSYACADAALWTGIETKESIEPIVDCIEDFNYLKSYFFYNVKRDGKEIYSMDEEGILRGEAINCYNLALEYLNLAEYNLKGEYFRGAADAGYNSCELCVKAFLLLSLGEIPKTHGGVIQKFGQLWIKPGTISPDVGRRLNRALGIRNDARYKYHARIAKEEAKEVIELARKLIEILKKHL